MSVTIRRAHESDAGAVMTMVREIAEHEAFLEHVQVTEEDWTELLRRPDVVVLLAERTGEPVGYVSAVRQLHLWSGGDNLALDDLYVRPGYRDAGAGRLLMLALAELAAADRLLIRWGMEADNVDAQRFYRRLGASLRTKVIAAWTADSYAALLATHCGATLGR